LQAESPSQQTKKNQTALDLAEQSCTKFKQLATIADVDLIEKQSTEALTLLASRQVPPTTTI
jgi:hypothetical protein